MASMRVRSVPPTAFVSCGGRWEHTMRLGRNGAHRANPAPRRRHGARHGGAHPAANMGFTSSSARVDYRRLALRVPRPRLRREQLPRHGRCDALRWGSHSSAGPKRWRCPPCRASGAAAGRACCARIPASPSAQAFHTTTPSSQCKPSHSYPQTQLLQDRPHVRCRPSVTCDRGHLSWT
eukprot:scaffold8603_cov109-Isochrysis_galbana.AAC.6